MSNFIAGRTLNEYPRGGYRWVLILLAVMASFLAGFPTQLGPLIPLFLPYLGMSRLGFGYFITATVPVGVIASLVGGPLLDRYGRVPLINLCLGGMLILQFLTLLIPPHGIVSFVIIRGAMVATLGLTYGGIPAIMRDYSPRVSRGLALGISVFASVIFTWFANFIAGRTLPIYHTWQSQIWIIGIIGVLMYIPVLLWLRDLSPQLRASIMETEGVAAAEPKSEPVAERPTLTGVAAYRAVLRHPQIPLLIVAMGAEITLYLAIVSFGSLILVDAFGYSTAAAAAMVAYFFLLNPTFVLLGGWLSDVVRVRRTMSAAGGLLAAVTLAWWLPGFGHTPASTTLILVCLLGAFTGIAYGGWGPLFSEAIEDIEPSLQATGFALFLAILQMWTAISATLALWVAQRYSWRTWMIVCLAGLLIHVVCVSLTGLMREREPTPEIAVQEAGQGGL